MQGLLPAQGENNRHKLVQDQVPRCVRIEPGLECAQHLGSFLIHMKLGKVSKAQPVAVGRLRTFERGLTQCKGGRPVPVQRHGCRVVDPAESEPDGRLIRPPGRRFKLGKFDVADDHGPAHPVAGGQGVDESRRVHLV